MIGLGLLSFSFLKMNQFYIAITCFVSCFFWVLIFIFRGTKK